MKHCFSICLILNFIYSFGQPPSHFYTTLGAEGDEVGFSVKQTLDSEYVVAGSSTSYGTHGLSDVYLVKVDPMGFPRWTSFIGGTGSDAANSVIQLPDSGFVLVGYTNSIGEGGYDIYIIRTNKNGSALWEKTWGGNDWDFGTDLTISADGSLFIVGYTYSFGNGKTDGVVLKYDLSGNLLGQKIFGGTENEEFNAIINTNDNKLAIVGLTESYSDPLGDHYFLKIDLTLDTIFVKTFGNPGKSYLKDLVQFPNGDYILVGAETYTDLPFTQSYRGKINSNADQFDWQGNSWTHDDNESWVSVTKSIKGSLRTSTLRDFQKDAFKTQGSIFSNPWYDYYPSIVNEFGGEEDEHLYSHEGTLDGGFVCVGSTESFESKGKDIFFIKLDSSIYGYSSAVGFRSQLENRDKHKIVVRENLIQISSNTNYLPANLEIFDVTGRIIKNVQIQEETTSIEREFFDKSIYIFRFSSRDRESITKKVLIQ